MVLTLLVVAGGSGGGAVGAGGASEAGISDGSHSPLRRSGPGLSPCNNSHLGVTGSRRNIKYYIQKEVGPLKKYYVFELPIS